MNGSLDSYPIKISETPKTKSIDMEDDNEEEDEEAEIKEVKKGKPHNYYCSYFNPCIMSRVNLTHFDFQAVGNTS